MKKITMILSSLLLLLSCASKARLVQSQDYSKQHTVERIIDTVELIRSDTAIVEALLECDSLGRVRMAQIAEMGGALSELRTSLENNHLEVEVVSKEIERVREVIRIDTLYLERQITEVVEVERPTPRWKQILMWIGLLAIGYLGLRVYRLFSLL